MRLDSEYSEILNKASRKALGLYRGADGHIQIRQSSFTGAGSQQWKILPDLAQR